MNTSTCYLFSFSLGCLQSRWLSATRTEMMKRSYRQAPARNAEGPVSAAPTRGVAWREDAAVDIRSRTAEAMLLPQHHPAALTLTQTASCPSVANALKTSVKGKAEGRVTEWKTIKRRNFIFAPILAWTWADPGFKRFSQEGLFWSRLYFKPWEIAPTEMESQIIPQPVEHLSVSQETAWLQVLYCISVLERTVHSVSSQSREFNYIVI